MMQAPWTFTEINNEKKCPLSIMSNEKITVWCDYEKETNDYQISKPYNISSKYG